MMSHIQAGRNSGRQCRRANMAVGAALSLSVLGVIAVGGLSYRDSSSVDASVAATDSPAKQRQNSEFSDFFSEDRSVSANAGLSGQFIKNVFSDGDTKSNGLFRGLDAKTARSKWGQTDDPSAAPVFRAVATTQLVSDETTNRARSSVQQTSGFGLPSLPETYLPPDNTGDLRRSESNSLLEFNSQSPFSRLEDVFSPLDENLEKAAGRRHLTVSQMSPKPLVVKPGWAADAAARTKQLDDESREFFRQVAATVNGTSISHRDILGRHLICLKALRDFMIKSIYQEVLSDEPTDEAVKKIDELFEQLQASYRMILQQLTQRDIAVAVQRRILFDYLQTNVSAKQWARAESSIDEQFPKQVDELMQHLKVDSPAQLEQALGDLEIDLQQVKNDFALDQLSSDCIKIFCQPIVLAPEIEEYYSTHQDKFQLPSIADWQQICAPCATRAEQTAAKAKLQSVLSQLNSGRLFGDDELVPRASENSQLFKVSYLQVQFADFKDTELKNQVANAEFNQWTPIFETIGMLCAVRVTNRIEAHIKPLEEVQDEIRETLCDLKRRDLVKQFLHDIYLKTNIETAYDLPTEMISAK